MFHLERNLYSHPLAGLLWERRWEEALSTMGEGTFLGLSFRPSKITTVLDRRCRRHKDGKKGEQNLGAMW